MAVKFRQIGFKVYDQLTNGTTFNQNLTKYKDNLAGYVGGRYKVINDFAVSVYWVSQTGSETRYQFNFNDNWIAYEGVDWVKEGFTVGDTIGFSYYYNGAKFNNNGGVITSFSGDRIYFDDITPNGNFTIFNTAEKLSVYLFSKKQSINYSFGFVENNDEFSNNSLLTGASQTYYGSYLMENQTYSLSQLGENKDWVSGNCKFRGNARQDVTDINGFKLGVEFNYQVTHEFILNPFYREGDISRLTNENGLIQPSFLAGDFSLKYVFETELRRELSNPNTAISYKQQDLLGSVAYFNENYNGFNNNYEVQSVNYTDVATGEELESINPSTPTYVNAVINKLSGTSITSDHYVNFSIFKCTSQEEYTNTTNTDLEQNFLFNNELTLIDGTSNTGEDIITELVVTPITTSSFSVRAKIEYSNENQLKINEGDFFTVSCAVQNSSLDAGSEDTVNLLLDTREYTAELDIFGLATAPKFELYEPIGGTAYSSIYAFNEDNINAKTQIVLDLTKEAFINNLSTKLIAYNPTTADTFELDSYNIDYSEVISNGVQQLEFDSSKPYPDSIRDEQRDVILNLDSSTANNATYNLDFGQKLNWKDWVYNRDVNTSFYDNSKPNNNLNFKASNYSNLLGYEIRLGIQSNIFGFDDLGRSGNTDYLFLSQKITTFDYDSNEDLDGVIELFDAETLTSLGTSPRTDKDTLFKVTWFDVSAGSEDWFINRIERSDNVGDAIYELSSFTDYNGGILKPLNGETKLKVEQVGNNLEVKCLIDYTKLEQGVTYNLTGRINGGSAVDPNAKLKTSGVIKTKTDQVVKLKAI